MSDSQFEIFPMMRHEERLDRALKRACAHLRVRVKQTWPGITPATLHMVEHACICALAAYVTDIQASD